MRNYLFLLITLASPLLASAQALTCTAQSASSNELQQWREENDCRDLEIGEKRNFDKSDFDSPTGISANYIISKTAENKYQIEIPLSVHEMGLQGFKSRLGFAKSATEIEMAERIKKCAAEYSEYLKGPNGESLQLLPVVNSEKVSRAKLRNSNTVLIDNASTRSSAVTYSDKASCATIAHELLHFAGLVDEYEEQVKEDTDSHTGRRHDCRVQGPAGSIMQDSDHALELLKKGHIDSYGDNTKFFFFSICPEDKSYFSGGCFSTRIKGKDGDQQKAYEQVKATYSGLAGQAGTFTKGMKIKLLREEVIQKKIQKDSLLEPAHFRAIVYPGCKKKNSTYYKCAQVSRRSSGAPLKIGGVTVLDERECNVPMECHSGQWLK